MKQLRLVNGLNYMKVCPLGSDPDDHISEEYALLEDFVKIHIRKDCLLQFFNQSIKNITTPDG